MSGTLTRVHETLTSEQIQRVLEISGLLDLNEESAAELLLESRRKAQFFTPGTSSVNIVMHYFFTDTFERLELIFHLFLQQNNPTYDPEVCQVIHQFTDALMSARPNNLLSLLIGRFRVAILSSENGNFGTLFRDECLWLAACINAICSTRSERLEQNFEELTNLLQMISGRFPDPFNGTNSFTQISVDILFGVMHCVLPDVRLPTNMLATMTALPDPYSAPISLCLSLASEDLKLSNESVRSAFSKNVFQYLSHFVGSDTFEHNNTTCEIIGTLLSRVLQGFLSKPYASSQPKAMADILGLIYGLYKVVFNFSP
ncbi:hypothetical protein Pelo_19027 [Pelomyxa schiedti]|nr:hypothetical protein Pelo_19027 [Pelomyxa schiedti]